MSNLGDLLNELPVPEHGADFWAALEDRLDTASPVTDPVTGIDGGELLDAPTGDDVVDLDERRRTRRRWIVLAVTAAAAITALVIGLASLTEDAGPVDTVDSTPPAEDNEDGGGGDPVPTAVRAALTDLAWTESSADTQDDLASSFLGVLRWTEAGFATFDSTESVLRVSETGDRWAPATFMPEGFEAAEWVATNGDRWVLSAGRSTAEFAVSDDGGANWTTRALEQTPPDVPSFVNLFPGSVTTFITADAVLVQINHSTFIDDVALMRDAGYSAEDLVVVGASSSEDGGYAVSACDRALAAESPDQAWCQQNANDYDMGDIGFDPSRGQVIEWYASHGDGAFTPVPAPTDRPSTVLTVGDEFVVVDDGGGETEPRILRSRDGRAWSETVLDAGSTNSFQRVSVVSTGELLFSVRGNRIIRSADAGRTWDELAELPGTIFTMTAGPAGVALAGELDDGSPPQERQPAVVERDGYSITFGVDGIVVTNPAGEIIARSSNEAAVTTHTLEREPEGPVNFRIREVETGEVVFEVTWQDTVDIGIGNGGGDTTVEPTRVIAWSPDGEGLEWTPVTTVFGLDDGDDASMRSLGVGDRSLVATLESRPPARPVDARSLIDFAQVVDPIEGNATVMYVDSSATQTFVAELP